MWLKSLQVRWISNALGNKLKFERQINSSLSKLERLGNLLPEQDPNKQKAQADLQILNDQWSQLMSKEESDSQTEYVTKKLMTVAKSKYYMLKVNYPQLALVIDNEPLFSESEEPALEANVKVKKLDELSKPIEVDDPQARADIYAKDKKASEFINAQTQELIKGMEILKEVDRLHQESGIADHFKKIEYVEREENLEMKEIYEQEQIKFHQISEKMKGKVDGEINMDLHGNMDIKHGSGITETGTYVLRDGKLVLGKAETREQATHSNWYCSNADPEDIRRHREMMDRMHYRGPKWEGIGIPKSIIEEKNPVYRKVDPEPHPSTYADRKEGKKGWENVVR